MEIHFLKTWPEYFNRIINGQKKFEVRKYDRDFNVGDVLVLQEYDNKEDRYTGRQVQMQVTYFLTGGKFGIESGFCVMGIEPMPANKYF